MSPYSPAEIKKFASRILGPLIARDFLPFHGNRALVRQRANFVQLVALSGGRYGETLKVLPTFYVVGARPSDEVIPQSISLNAEYPDKWRFQDRHLDGDLAGEICKLLTEQSPLSFFSPIGIADVVAALELSAANAVSEDAPLFLAFFMMANGISGEKKWLGKARKCFQKQNPVILHDWQRETSRRIEALEQRINVPGAEILCQQEAEDHALRLNLPRITWSESLS